MASKYGNCPSCKRENVLMPGPKCSRCYDRIKRGKHVITGEPIKPLRAHDIEPAGKTATATTTKPAKAAPLAPAILADDETENAAPVSPTPAAGSTTAVEPEKKPSDDFNVDVLAAIDSAWLVKRDVFIGQLQAATKTADRLRIAFHTLATIQAMGFEA